MKGFIPLCLALLAVVLLATADRRDCNDDEKASWKGYISKSDTTDARYEGLNCCFIRSTSGTMGQGSEARVVTFRYWACPPGAIPNSSATANNGGEQRLKRFRLQQEEGDGEDEDEPVEIVEIQAFVPWHLDRIDQFTLPRNGVYYPRSLPAYEDQEPVHVYVVDTGLDPTHDVFNNVEISMDYPSPDGAIDCNNHGTHVVSLIIAHTVGVLATSSGHTENRARVVVHVVRVLKCTGTGTTFDVIEGLLWIKAHGHGGSVINLSLGSPKSPSLNSVLEALRLDNGYQIIAAGGNSNIDACTTSPSSAQYVVAVGASREDDKKSSYSNYGLCIDIFAPGNNIYGAKAQSINKLFLMSGTSMASPMVAGATLRCQLQLGVDAVTAYNTCVLPQTTNGVLTNIGTGSPNKLVFVGDSETPLPPSNESEIPPTDDNSGGSDEPSIEIPPSNVPSSAATITEGCGEVTMWYVAWACLLTYVLFA